MVEAELTIIISNSKDTQILTYQKYPAIEAVLKTLGIGVTIPTKMPILFIALRMPVTHSH